MKISTEEEGFHKVTIVLESEKELDCLRVASECMMDETLGHAAREKGLSVDDLDDFLDELSGDLPEDDC